jgi:hypothetical protein
MAGGRMATPGNDIRNNSAFFAGHSGIFIEIAHHYSLKEKS